jgi:hypothetical protein
MSSAAEAELGALFINAKTAISMQQTLIKLGHLQPRTPIQADNATAHALLTNKILPKALKAMTCVSTGYNAVTPKINSVITGDLEHRPWQTTILSTTQPHTTRVYAPPY